MYLNTKTANEEIVDFYRAKSENPVPIVEDIMLDLSKKKTYDVHQQSQNEYRQVLIIYASGSMAANNNLEIPRGQLKRKMQKNFYFCDYKQSLKQDPSLETLISEKFENGIRIKYRIKELSRIEASIQINNLVLRQIAQIIENNYNDYDSFLIIAGMDTICQLGASLSFMLENLNKLVIITGGYLPLFKIRNDSAMNLIESFAMISQASSLNDVIIANKNKGYRANRCIKKSEGDFESITSPNLPAIVSIKSKMTIRSYLIQPRSSQPFSVFHDLSSKVKVLKLNCFESIQSIEYELNNPYIKGIVIESYSFANIPNNQDLLNLFKKTYQQKKTIFLNISQSVKSNNQSVMQDYLKSYHIHYGADMTSEAAIAKLSYLIGKEYTDSQIISQLGKNLRGQLTSKKQKTQFELNQSNLMDIVAMVIKEQYPTNIKQKIVDELSFKVASYIANFSPEQFWKIFNKNSLDEKNKSLESKDNEQLLNFHGFLENHCILHLIVQRQNLQMVEQLFKLIDNINIKDKNKCSAMFYALKNQNKEMIHLFKKHGGKVAAPVEYLFDIFLKHLKKDNCEFFQLLAHMEFRETLKTIINHEHRNVAHIAALLKSTNCYNYIKEKLLVPIKVKDIYGKTASQYMNAQNVQSILPSQPEDISES